MIQKKKGDKMNTKLELIQNHISDFVKEILSETDFDIIKIADTTAIIALDEIKNVICNDELSDFDAVEEIVCILEKNNVDCGSRHDF